MRFWLLIAMAIVAPCLAQDMPRHQALPAAAKPAIAATDVVLVIGQKEIFLQDPPPGEPATYRCARDPGRENSLLVGLAKVTGDTDVIKICSPETALAPVRSVLTGFDFDAKLRDAISRSTQALAWLHAGSASLQKDGSDARIAERLTGSTGSAVLLLSSRYYFSYDGEHLFAELWATLLPNSDALRALASPTGAKAPLANALYRNVFTYQSSAKFWAHTNREGYMNLWSENGGAQIQAAMTQATTKFADLLAADLNDEIVAGKKTRQLTSGERGTIAKRDGDGVWVRVPDGAVIYLSNTVADYTPWWE